MRSEWVEAFQTTGMTVAGEYVQVALAEEQRHRVRVLEDGATVRLTAVVLRAARVRVLDDVIERVWKRNRGARLSGFRVDDGGRLVGEAVMPAVGLTTDELVFRLQLLAADCDRFEHALTGLDLE